MSMHVSDDSSRGLDEPVAASTPSNKGFCVQLQGASILDLVQLQCLARSRLSARITSGRHIGYLDFNSGSLVHAEFNHLSGERAALAILALDTGSFEAVDRPVPAEPSIRASWQHLVLAAAQRKDEESRNPAAEDQLAAGAALEESAFDEPDTLITGAPVSSIARRREARMARGEAPIEASAVAEAIPASQPRSDRRFPLSTWLRDDYGQALAYVQLDPAGEIIESEGASEDLAAIVSYAVRLAKLLGEGLGLERFGLLEGQYKEQRVIAFERADLVTAVLAPNGTSISKLRHELRL